jgi:hypothetical protein
MALETARGRGLGNAYVNGKIAFVAGCRRDESSWIGDVNQPTIEGIQQTAEQFRQMIEAQTGSRLDFDLPSLARLDSFLAEWLDLASVYGSQDDRMLEPMMVPVASFVGEVLVRTFGAVWSDEFPGAARLPLLRLPTGQRIDLEESVATILRGLARPAFYQLAAEISHSSAGEMDGS